MDLRSCLGFEGHHIPPDVLTVIVHLGGRRQEAGGRRKEAVSRRQEAGGRKKEE